MLLDGETDLTSDGTQSHCTYRIWCTVDDDIRGQKSSHCRHISTTSSIIQSFLILQTS